MVKNTILITSILLLICLILGCSQPLFYQWSSEKVINIFQANGLEAVDPRPATEADYQGAPMVAKDALYFSIPSAGAGEGGLVMAFESADALAQVKTYFEERAKNSETFVWVLSRDNIVVILSGKLSQVAVNQYDGVLAKLRYVR